MLIDPQGLLRGDRVRACSDDAQLHFPRLLAASNTFGRFRMSVEWLRSEVYGSFTEKPSKDALTQWLREYHDNFLLFVYRAPDNSMWAQWEIPEKLLGKYRLTADRKTPAPPAVEHEAYRRAYAESLRVKNSRNPDEISEGFQNVPKSSGSFQKVPHHVGVGVGVGVDVKNAPATPSPSHSGRVKGSAEPHPLHTDCRLAILAYWTKHVQPGAEPTWDGSEAKALDSLLRALPTITLARFTAMLNHRGQSDVNPCERPRRWIASLPDYELGPLDAFGKPKKLRASSAFGPAIVRPLGVNDTAQLLSREEEEKNQVLEGWRQARVRGDPEYESAPAWVRGVLEAETAEAVA